MYIYTVHLSSHLWLFSHELLHLYYCKSTPNFSSWKHRWKYYLLCWRHTSYIYPTKSITLLCFRKPGRAKFIIIKQNREYRQNINCPRGCCDMSVRIHLNYPTLKLEIAIQQNLILNIESGEITIFCTENRRTQNWNYQFVIIFVIWSNNRLNLVY